MTREEKQKFVIALCDGIKVKVLEAVDAMPEEWDGHELREYIKDQAAISAAWVKMKPTRLRAYRNELRVNGKI